MTDTPDQPARKRRRWPWPLRLLTIFAIFVIVLLLFVQILFWSPIPRRIAESQATRILGLRVQIDDVSIGWTGRTRIRGLRVSLPLEDAPMIEVPEVRATHTNPLLVVFGLSIDRVEIDQPVVSLRQLPAGTWNLQEAITRITADRPPADPSPGVPQLPSVVINDARVTATTNDGRSAALDPIRIVTDGSDPLVYRLKLTIADQVDVQGLVLPGRDWRQIVDFKVGQLAPVVEEFYAALPENFLIKGTWDGAVSNDGLVGSLALHQVEYGDLAVSANVGVATADALAVETQFVNVQTGQEQIGDVRVGGGAVRIVDGNIRVENLGIQMLGGAARLNAGFDPRSITGAVEVLYDRLTYAGATASGQLDATLGKTTTGGPAVNVTLLSHGSLADLKWSTTTSIAGTGRDFLNMNWTISGDADLSGMLEFRARGVTATLRNFINEQGQFVAQLDDLTIPGEQQIAAIAGIVLAEDQPARWWVWTNGRNIEVDVPHVGLRKLYLNLNSWGEDGVANIDALYVRVGDIEISGGGRFLPAHIERPLDLRLAIQQIGAMQGADLRDRLIRGDLDGTAEVYGFVHPAVKLSFKGKLQSRDLNIAGRQVGDISAELNGGVDIEGLAFRADNVELLGGRWDIAGLWPRDKRRTIGMNLAVTGLPMTQIGQLTEIDGLLGSVNAEARIRVPDGDFSRAFAEGKITGEQLGHTAYAIDSVEIPYRFENGQFEAKPTARLGEGTADAVITTTLSNPALITTSFDVRQWPAIPGGGISANLDLKSDRIEINTGAPGPGNTKEVWVTGKVDVALTGAIAEKGLADLKLVAEFDRRAGLLRDFAGDIMGGTVSGGARIDIDNPLAAFLELKLSGLEADQIVAVFPQLGGLAGRFDGLVRLGPATDPRPLGPMRLDLNLFAFDASYKTAAIGNSYLIGFFDRSEGVLPLDRFVTNDARIAVAGGEILPFARVSLRNGTRAIWTQTTVRVQNLDVAQLAGAAIDDPPAVAGLIAGDLNAFGNVLAPAEMTADGRFRVTRGDFARIPIIADIFDLARGLAGGGGEAVGTASIEFRFENDRLTANRAELFDRGLFLEGLNVVLDGVTQWPQTRISGHALASARPLRSIEVPLFAELFANADEIMNAVQREATTIRVSGTIEDYRVDQAAVSEVFGELRNMLGG